MRPSGLAEVEAAKADGMWDTAYESQRHATIAPDRRAGIPSAGAYPGLGERALDYSCC
jgi:hypothetical protein